jgi:hypothetical protein
MKNKLILYALFFLFGIYGSEKNLIHTKNITNNLPSTHTPIRSFLENHLLLFSSLLGVCGIVTFFILRNFYKEFNKISFNLDNEILGNKLTNKDKKQINNTILEEPETEKESQNLIECIKLILKENDYDQERTKQAEAEDREERDEKISEEDMKFL